MENKRKYLQYVYVVVNILNTHDLKKINIKNMTAHLKY